MVKTRRLVWTLLICFAFTAVAAFAQTTLTQILDTVVNPDGSPFNGTVVITWNGFTGSNSGTAPLSTSARIYSGALSVLLVPTTTASVGTFYQVVYYSNSGAAAWTETWQVPPSATPLTLGTVRTSGSGGSGGSGGTGSGGTTGGSGTGQYATLPIAINQVTSLSADLASINSAIAALTTQLNNLGTSGGGTSASYVDAENPAGSLDGSNAAFTLAQTPSPVGSLNVYRNGLLQSLGVDYTANASAICFLVNSVPKATDIVTAFYRLSAAGPSVSFTDSETPTGAVDGSNLTFTLSFTPNPLLSLKLYKNGILLNQNSDYLLSGNTINFSALLTPQLGDLLLASYRR